ncbi:MAG: hypothetical protein ABI809_05180 [Caldimonas sp.]
MKTTFPRLESRRDAVRPGAALLLALALAGPAGAQLVSQKYVVTDLGTLGGTEAAALGINNAGQVVGYSQTPGDAATRAFRTAPNRSIAATDDLGTLGGPNSVAYSINSTGQVAGDADTADAGPFSSIVRRAFRADPGAPMIDLGTLAPNGGANGFNNSGGRAINDAANVVGFATVPADLCASSSHAFRTYPGQTINASVSNLGTLVPYPFLGCRSSIAWGVNSLSLTVGSTATTVTTGYPNHAFRYTPFGGMIDIGTLGGRDSQAFAVNDLAEVVGDSKLAPDAVNNPFDSPHAFLSQGIAGPRDLGTLGGTYSTAVALNMRYPLDSQVVGTSSTTGDAAVHAFLWTGNVWNGGTMVDLNSLIAANSGWELKAARAINNKGQVVCDGYRNGSFRAVRLDPADVAVGVLIGALSDPTYQLTDGQVNSLTDKLQSVYNSIQQGLVKQAVNQLNAYLNSIDSYAKNGKITTATAAALTAAGRAILAIL